MKIQRRNTYIMTIEGVICNSSNKNPPFEGKGLVPGDGMAEIKVHPKLLEILASSENGVFSVSDIDKGCARLNPGNSDKTKIMILSIHYADNTISWYKDHTPRTYLTWNQFIRNGRPTKIKVRKEEYLSKL